MRLLKACCREIVGLLCTSTTNSETDVPSISSSACANVPPWPSFPLGVTITDIGEALRKQLRLGDSEGVAIGEVLNNMAAKDAGLKRHDIIRRIDDVVVSGVEDVRRLVKESEGAPLRIEYIRAGQQATVEVTPTPGEPPYSAGHTSAPAAGWIHQFHVNRARPGVLWSPGKSVPSGGPSAQTRHDRLDAISRQLEELTKAVRELKDSETNNAQLGDRRKVSPD